MVSAGEVESIAVRSRFAEGVGGRDVRICLKMCKHLWKESDGGGAAISERSGGRGEGVPGTDSLPFGS